MEISRMEAAPQELKWKILSRLTDPGRQMGIQPVKVNGNYVFNDDEILAEMENVHIRKQTYQSSSAGLIDQHVTKWITDAADELPQTLHEVFDEEDDPDLMNARITYEEVARTFGQCSNTPGPDGVSGLMLDKADRELMIGCLLRLWNAVWISNTIPSEWKLEHRKLVSKAGKDSYNECTAYRTVSMTDILGKRLEKVVLARLMCELERQGFDERQFAYLTLQSSTLAVLSLVEEIKNNILEHKFTGVLFF